jgi:hypothetical protein
MACARHLKATNEADEHIQQLRSVAEEPILYTNVGTI